MQPSGVVLSPGPGRPEDAGICINLIERSAQLPILGVCLGHQCLANAYGGLTSRSGDPTHGRASECEHYGDDFFAGVPRRFMVGRYHSLTVEAGPQMRVTARTLAGEVMAMRHKRNPHFGVQFHPESLLTPHGLRMIRTFVKTTQTHAVLDQR
jgi:anthranilate synthase/aminodeoxychorismate synthase-like glutamine amidotransferase